jgi:transcriptional regulator with XRE-family HTH domain
MAKKATKSELEHKRELVRLYYMQGDTQKEIAINVDVSETTISKWVSEGGWDVIRAARNITQVELVNKMLRAINTILDNYLESDNPEKSLDVSKLTKLAKSIRDMNKKTGIVEQMETFSAFKKWMSYRMNVLKDKEINIELIQTINRYQELYIAETISIKK